MTTVSPTCRLSSRAPLPFSRIKAPGAGVTRHSRPPTPRTSRPSGGPALIEPAKLRSGVTLAAAGTGEGEGDGRAVDVARGVGRGGGGLPDAGLAGGWLA